MRFGSDSGPKFFRKTSPRRQFPAEINPHLFTRHKGSGLQEETIYYTDIVESRQKPPICDTQLRLHTTHPPEFWCDIYKILTISITVATIKVVGCVSGDTLIFCK